MFSNQSVSFTRLSNDDDFANDPNESEEEETSPLYPEEEEENDYPETDDN